MDELNKQYSPSFWSKRFSSPEEVITRHLNFIEEASSKVTKSIQCELDIPYGDTERQKIDVYGVDLPKDAPVLVFVHGGYWQTKELKRSSYHFIAKRLYQQGIKSIFMGYDLCPDVTFQQIMLQVRNGARRCLEYARKQRSRGVYFMGHSAGAHLIASLFTGFIKSLPEDDQFILKGVFLTSGVFDLTPLQKTINNEPLKLDEKMAIEMSPQKQSIFASETKFHIIVGENDSPEFIRQSREFREKLKNLEIEADFSVIANVDHFDILERLDEEDYELTKYVIKIIKSK